MSTITGIQPFSYLSYLQASGANRTNSESQDVFGDTNASTAAPPQSGPATTGFAAAPRLSANVIDALIQSQSQPSPAGGSSAGTAAPATSLAGAPALSDPTVSSNSSGPETLQQIAQQFDPNDLTDQQVQQLRGDLVSSGALSEQDGLTFEGTTLAIDLLNADRQTNGRLTATATATAPTSAADPTSGGHDAVQEIQQALTSSEQNGDTAGVAGDQRILDVLNELSSLRGGAAA